MDSLSVLVVDDHAVVRAGLRAVMNAEPGLRVVGEAEDGLDACAVAAALQPDIVIMDVSMPALNGADATRRLITISPASRVIALTAHDEPPYVRELLDAGARGYVLKRGVMDHLIRAVWVVSNGGVFLDPTLAAHPASGERPDPTALTADLSTREIDVGSMTALGHSNGEISAELNISVKTVETHKSRLMMKLGFRTRAQLVRYALYRGWVKG